MRIKLQSRYRITRKATCCPTNINHTTIRNGDKYRDNLLFEFLQHRLYCMFDLTWSELSCVNRIVADTTIFCSSVGAVKKSTCCQLQKVKLWRNQYTKINYISQYETAAWWSILLSNPSYWTTIHVFNQNNNNDVYLLSQGIITQGKWSKCSEALHILLLTFFYLFFRDHDFDFIITE